jgi:hydrolase, alpha/beta domain protein
MDYTYQTVKMYYEKRGNGDAVILLHGWGCDGRVFDEIANILEKKYTVYSLDLLGFGKSEEPPHPYTLDEYVDFLINFVKDNKIIAPILIGHSFGGRIAIRYAKSEAVNKLILIDSAGIRPRDLWVTKTKICIYKIKKKWFKLTKNVTAYQKLIQNSGSNDYKNATPIMKKTLSLITTAYLEKDLKQIHTDALIIWGKKDKTTPYTDALKMHKLLKNSGIVAIENAGHFPFLEQKSVVLAVIKSYLGVE